MDELKFRRMSLIRDIVDNPLFNEIMAETKATLAQKMLSTEDEAKRNELYHEGKALDRVRKSLTAIANAVRAVESANKEKEENG